LTAPAIGQPISPYPPARAARVPSPANGKLSAVLVARPMGCLVVRVTFHKRPCAGLEVTFSEAGADGSAGAAVGPKVVTDPRGLAKVPWMVPAGRYVCQIENQLPTLVTTVHDPARPYPVVTPILRPYYDVDEEHEWHDEDLDGPFPASAQEEP
jgi:hypothetical protein